MSLRVVVVSPVRLYGEALARALEQADGTDVVGTAAGGAPAATVVAATRPDVAVVDAPLVRLHGLVDRIRVGHPPLRVVAFGVRDDLADIAACARAGVAGYVSRDAGTSDLHAVIAAVGAGALGCTPAVAATLLSRVSELSAEMTAIPFPIGGSGPRGILTGPAPEDVLSERELEILSLVGEGLMNKQIARRLGIALSTVKNHVHHILQKEAVASRHELARMCHGAGAPPVPRARGHLDPARIPS